MLLLRESVLYAFRFLRRDRPVVLLPARVGRRNRWGLPADPARDGCRSDRRTQDLTPEAAEHKRLVIFEDAGHVPPRIDVIREVLDLLDRYLGTVQRSDVSPSRAIDPLCYACVLCRKTTGPTVGPPKGIHPT